MIDLSNVMSAALGQVTPQVGQTQIPAAVVSLAAKVAEAVDAHRDAEARAAVLKADLIKLMKEHGVAKVPMPDRAPITIKTGERSSMSLTYLKEKLGPVQADLLWSGCSKSYENLDVPKSDPQPSV